MMRIEVGYPDAAAEKEILKRFTNSHHQRLPEPVLRPTEVLLLQEESRNVHVEEAIVDYIIHIVNRTRQHPEIELGISPRGTAALFRAAQSLAMLDGRSFVIPDDVKKLVYPVFQHRLVMVRGGSRAHGQPGLNAMSVLAEILEQARVPA